MKRKQLVAVGILSICLLACGCGNNTTITGQDAEDTVIVQESETQETGEAETQEVETQEVETQEAEPQETETQETTETVEETENYENYEELVSVPADGRDGSQEKPYEVGDEIYFPKVYVGDENGNAQYSSISVVIEEATADYIKISYKFGDHFWDTLYDNALVASWYDMDATIMPFRFNKEFEQIGTQCSVMNQLNKEEDLMNFTGDEKEAVWYWQDFDGKGCIDGTEYIMLLYTRFSIPVEETEAYFNCTFIKIAD